MVVVVVVVGGGGGGGLGCAFGRWEAGGIGDGRDTRGGKGNSGR